MGSVDFFMNPQFIRTKVPEATYERGMNLYLTQQVLECNVRYSSSREWDIEGTVQGSVRQPYEVSVSLEIAPDGSLSDFHGTCTCPVGSNCKHAVALTIKAACCWCVNTVCPRVAICGNSQPAASIPVTRSTMIST